MCRGLAGFQNLELELLLSLFFLFWTAIGRGTLVSGLGSHFNLVQCCCYFFSNENKIGKGDFGEIYKKMQLEGVDREWKCHSGALLELALRPIDERNMVPIS
ncbi:hypothetical protein VNO80_30306 [Phaseolus coccineus]|uniref:Uncharacterized protein n=1 Tax=Phaseolus coccineus TaxID=3886 RepID=A0AAN9QFZ0_PHACN